MKKKLLLIFVLVACTLYGQKAAQKLAKTAKESTVSRVYKLSDPINFTDFEVLLNYNNDDIYSSVNSVFQRNYSNINRTVKFRMTKEEKALIYKTSIEVDFFSLPKELEIRNDISISPSFSREISIKIGNNLHRVYANSNLIKDPLIKKRFNQISRVIMKIIYSKKAVKALPESDKAYL
jgi:hypothetical protein